MSAKAMSVAEQEHEWASYELQRRLIEDGLYEWGRWVRVANDAGLGVGSSPLSRIGEGGKGQGAIVYPDRVDRADKYLRQLSKAQYQVALEEFSGNGSVDAKARRCHVDTRIFMREVRSVVAAMYLVRHEWNRA